jgi:hypothetical protein
MSSSAGVPGELRVSRQPVGEGDAGPGAVEREAEKEQEIDLQALARKVYTLLRQELRVERERLG